VSALSTLSRRRRPPLSAERLRDMLVPDVGTPANTRERVARTWWRTLRRLFPLGGHSHGNEVTIYNNGDDAFTAMFAAIEGARSLVWLETYILLPDALGRRVLDALRAAAERGLQVVLLHDAVGSSELRTSDTKPLRDAGVDVVTFNPLFRRRRLSGALMRDHRKILIADDVGFAGGMNISEDYAGPLLGNERFRDTHARITGPAVAALADVLARSYRVATKRTLPILPPAAEHDDGVFTQVLRSDVRRRRRHIQRALRQTIGRSMTRCWLTTPYFVPPPKIVRALKRAARRGVDVRVLTAGTSDVPIVRRASHHLYGRLLRAGVRIFELSGQTLHAKTATIDGLYAMVGSFNLDHWSWHRNLEVTLTIVDPDCAAQLTEQFERDLSRAAEVELTGWRRGRIEKVIDWIAYQLMKL
jgi:cardiolipin synthase